MACGAWPRVPPALNSGTPVTVVKVEQLGVGCLLKGASAGLQRSMSAEAVTQGHSDQAIFNRWDSDRISGLPRGAQDGGPRPWVSSSELLLARHV